MSEAPATSRGSATSDAGPPRTHQAGIDAALDATTSAVTGGTTEDTLLRGRVRIVQPIRGFRSSLDPVLLAGFVTPPFGRFLDVGCGTGAVSFLLLAHDDAASGVGIEIQPRLARCAALGIAANGCGARFTLRAEDARRAALPAAGFDLVVTNPPFRPLGAGVLPPDEERATAHHEVSLALADWVAIAARALRPEGRLAVVYPADRLPELLAEIKLRGLSPIRLRAVHPEAGQPARRVLVEARRGRGGPRTFAIEPPLVVHESGRYGAEVRRMLGEP